MFRLEPGAPALKTNLKFTRKTLKVRGGHTGWKGQKENLQVLRDLASTV